MFETRKYICEVCNNHFDYVLSKPLKCPNCNSDYVMKDRESKQEMIKQYFLKNQEGLYYSLPSALTSTSEDKSKATVFDTESEAFDWLEKHSIYDVKLEKLGFQVYSSKIGD